MFGDHFYSKQNANAVFNKNRKKCIHVRILFSKYYKMKLCYYANLLTVTEICLPWSTSCTSCKLLFSKWGVKPGRDSVQRQDLLEHSLMKLLLLIADKYSHSAVTYSHIVTWLKQKLRGQSQLFAQKCEVVLTCQLVLGRCLESP